MTSLYPFLSDDAQIRALAVLESDWDKGRIPSTLSENGEHVGREFPSWGGTPVSSADLARLREAVLAVAGKRGATPDGPAERRETDRRVGRALVEVLGGDPAALFTSGTWAFFSMVLLPDVVFTRYREGKKFPRDRFRDGRRNAFSTLYLRELVLPSSELSAEDEDDDLLADELVGLLDRSLVADRRLVRALVNRRDSAPSFLDRRLFFRELLREATFERTVTMTALLETDALEHLADQLVDRAVGRLAQ